MKLLIITGGSKGLGLALCDVYLAAGWRVLDISRSGNTSRSVGAADTVESAVVADTVETAETAESALHMTVDLADLDAAWADLEQKMAELAAQPWEQVMLINNAGRVTPVGPVSGLDDAQIVENLTINMLSGIRIIACFARHFYALNKPKMVVSLSSGAASKAYFGWSLYCAAKAGMENFMRAFAIEQTQVPHPFTCITFGPGVVDTDMQADIRHSTIQDFPDLPRFLELKQRGQLRSPASVAQVLYALCDGSIAGKVENGRRYNVDEFD
jgi:NAD(P)-dependent dehydrogenase (short-subunit alcohol dehydrogenase family)